MAYLELRDSRGLLGTYDLPSEVVSREDYRFRIMRAIRGGGNGVVFDSRKIDGKGKVMQICALKFLRQQEPVRKDRFSNEVRILRELDHERITRFYGDGSIDLEGYDVP